MASPLAEAHIEGQRRLRLLATNAVERAWRDLGSWNREDIDRFTGVVVPVVLTAQRSSVALTEAYLARALERQPLGVSPEEVIGRALRGVSPREVYSRPFVNVWTALQGGAMFEDAVAAGLARATATAAMDVQLAFRATANVVGEADDGIFGFTRVADAGACEFCSAIDGAYVKSADASPLHNHCGCGLEVNTSPHPLAAQLPPSVAVHQHGELGAVLADPAHDFTTAAQALS